jgi:hypothetical protein
MPFTYMILWSIVIILGLGIWRLRHTGQLMVIVLVTAVILFISQALFTNLSTTAGIDPNGVINLSEYLVSGPLAWTALLVRPCGWLGPIIGFHLIQSRAQNREPVSV